jgi:uncharacterized membrane protein YedE/YeeE
MISWMEGVSASSFSNDGFTVLVAAAGHQPNAVVEATTRWIDCVSQVLSVNRSAGACGLFLGYGARLDYGCNIGAYFRGIASGSLHARVGWWPSSSKTSLVPDCVRYSD